MQAIREDYASVLTNREAIKRSETDLEAKHERRREVEAKVSVSNDKQQKNSDQVVHVFIHEMCEGACDTLSHALLSIGLSIYLRFESGGCVFHAL